MSTTIAMLLLLFATGGYILWQRMVLRNALTGKQYEEEWFKGLYFTGAVFSLALVMNAISFMKLRGVEFEMAAAEGIMRPDGTFEEPSTSALATGQLEIFVGTLSLLVLLWQTMKRKCLELSIFNRRGHLQIMTSVIHVLLLPFWLATFGIGSIFGVSAGFGLRDVVRHVELLFGPPLILSVELTIIWIVLKAILKNERDAG